MTCKGFKINGMQMGQLIDAIEQEGKHGSDGMLVITFDESGGFYIRPRHEIKTIKCKP